MDWGSLPPADFQRYACIKVAIAALLLKLLPSKFAGTS